MVLEQRTRLPAQETVQARVLSLDQEEPLEKETATHSSVLPEESCGQQGLVGYSPWGHKESDRTECLSNVAMEFTFFGRV